MIAWLDGVALLFAFVCSTVKLGVDEHTTSLCRPGYRPT